jgi:hypothetical protein
MSETRLSLTFIGAAAIVALMWLSFVYFATALAYVTIGISGIALVALIGFAIRKWQQSGLPMRAHKLDQARLQSEHDLEYERIQLERDDREHAQLLALKQQAHTHTLELSRWQVEQHIALTRLPVEQYGTYLINQEQASLTHLAPVYKPVQISKDATALAAPGTPVIPARFDMRDIWRSFRPSMAQIFLGKSAAGDIIVPGNKLLHSVATGPTGGGKTNIVRMELMQLVYIGCQVTLMDIHYAPIKEDEDGQPIDWRPIVNRLDRAPIYDLGVIIKWMNWLAFTELQARIDRGRNGQPIGKPIFFSIAELPSVLDEAGDKIAQPLAKILRQGRQYLIFFVGDSNDLLTSTLHMTTGPRECFRTGFYTGGDPTTAKALLDLPNGVKVNEEGLGQQGLVYVKTAIHPYTQARVGWASNEALYELFETPIRDRIGYQSSGFPRSEVQPPVERDERDYEDGPARRIVDADMPEMEPLTRQEATARPSTQIHLVQPVEQPDLETEESPKDYRLSEEEIGKFIAAYRASGNIEKALAAIGRGSRYKKHASEIVRVYGLRKEA